MLKRALTLCMGIAIVAHLAACSVTDRITYADGEGRVPPDIIERIKSKPTSKTWIMSQLGDPIHIERIETAGRNKEIFYEIYTYRFSKTFIRSAQVFYVFKSGAREEEVEYFHITFEDGLSRRAWLDHMSRPKLASRLYKEKSKSRTTKVATKSHADELVEPETNDRTKWKLPILKRWFGDKNVPEAQSENSTQTEKSQNDIKSMEQSRNEYSNGVGGMKEQDADSNVPQIDEPTKGSPQAEAPTTDTLDLQSMDKENEVAL